MHFERIESGNEKFIPFPIIIAFEILTKIRIKTKKLSRFLSSPHAFQAFLYPFEANTFKYSNCLKRFV